MVIQSFAKVNLFLEVLNKRPDHFHNIDSLFERISLSDKIILKNRRDHLIKVSCNDPGVPLDETNLCFKAAKLLQHKFKIEKGLDIKIVKRIPVAAGLGGGSSNAASVLSALNRLWRLRLSKAKLAKFSAKLGSDVVFFAHNAAFARVRGRGEKIRVLRKLNKVRLWHILVVPKLHVSTPLIYKKWDDFGGLTPHLDNVQDDARKLNEKQGAGLTKPVSNVKILTSALIKKNSIFKPGFLFNSLEQITLKLYPEVIRVKETLAGLGVKSALMSGSGPAVFAPVASRGKALALVKKIKREKKPWLAFAVSTV